MEELGFRQIHMDFHTSEKILPICEKFDEEEFADTLKSSHVNSVTCFSRYHHGMLYYDSKKFPELVHPGLKQKNVLERQIKACHDRGIKVPVYTTVQWDYHMSMEHPEWACINPEGGFVYRCFDKMMPEIYEPGFYRTLCANTPYRDYLKTQIGDVFDTIGAENIDGIFLDIVNVVDCSCRHCVAGMKEKGYHPDVYEERVLYARGMLAEFKRDMTAFIKGFGKDISIFYNGSHVGSITMQTKDAYTHWELESLPSGKWGYTHFPNTVRYARTSGMDYLAHTGKFHTSWGDFHSLKNKEALEYECFRMLMYNSKCLIGDQLNPDGQISKEVYDLIGTIYEQVEKKEVWCKGAEEVVEIGILTSEYFKTGSDSVKKVPKEINGVCAMLDELGYQFNIIDENSDFAKYKVIILPDTILCGERLKNKITVFTNSGGHIIASAKSGLNEEKREFALGCLGIHYIGEAPYSPDFLMPTEKFGEKLPKTEHVMYNKGMKVSLQEATEKVKVYVPYFNRTWEHFCSHLHTPSSHQYGYPGITENKGNYYFIHPVFTIYQEKHPRWCKAFVGDVLESMIATPILKHTGPSTMVAALNEQKEQKRYILHALHYIPNKIAEELLTIEDKIVLYDIKFTINVPCQIKSVRMVPEKQEIPFQMNEEGCVEFTIPCIDGHSMVEMTY